MLEGRLVHHGCTLSPQAVADPRFANCGKIERRWCPLPKGERSGRQKFNVVSQNDDLWCIVGGSFVHAKRLLAWKLYCCMLTKSKQRTTGCSTCSYVDSENHKSCNTNKKHQNQLNRTTKPDSWDYLHVFFSCYSNQYRMIAQGPPRPTTKSASNSKIFFSKTSLGAF